MHATCQTVKVPVTNPENYLYRQIQNAKIVSWRQFCKFQLAHASLLIMKLFMLGFTSTKSDRYFITSGSGTASSKPYLCSITDTELFKHNAKINIFGTHPVTS